ncbi:MAG: PDZ domain-containing protein [Anaerolineae bacterium]|nr:PDZ domain-containing protein [Anaerolineae bacterium]
MGDTPRNRTALVAVITGLIALFLGLCLGLTVGGVGGYLLGRAADVRLRLPLPLSPQAPAPPRLPLLPTPPLPLTPERPRSGFFPRAGALIQEVMANTPAAEAGLRVGDLIVRVDNIPVDADHRLSDIIARRKPGDKISLTVWRAGDTRTIAVTLGAHPDDAQRAYLGIVYVELPPQRITPQPGD